MSEMHSDRPLTFLCDQNLGRLARWLRMMGFDTEYMPVWDESTISKALNEGRFFLTRKRSMAGREGCIVIESDHLDDQLAALDRALGIEKKIQPFSLCSICNQPLKYVKPEDVKAKVPEYVYTTQGVFAECPSCSRIYWRGTHTKRSLEFFCSHTRAGRGR